MTCPHFFYGNCTAKKCLCPIVEQERQEFLDDLKQPMEPGTQDFLIEKWEGKEK